MRFGSLLEVNEFLVLDFVREHVTTSRPDIARELGLSPASVSRIIRRLLAEGVVAEGAGQSSGGRPRAAISFNARAGCVFGVDLGGTKCHGALGDLAGTILVEEIQPTNQAGAPYATLVAVIDVLFKRARKLDLPVVAGAVGVPAIVDPLTGVALAGPNVQWHGFPLVAELSSAVGVPLTVQNDVKLAGLAHAWRGDARRVSDFAVMSVGTGIGAAVFVDGRLAQGRHNAAGEIGFLTLDRSQLAEAVGDGPGALERMVSGPALATRYAALRHPGSDVSTEEVFARARDGEPQARGLIEDACDRVAMAIVALAAVADPELVILDGSVGRALEPWNARLAERVRSQLPLPPRVVPSSLGTNATVVGAVAAALQLARHQRAPAELVDDQNGRPGAISSALITPAIGVAGI